MNNEAYKQAAFHLVDSFAPMLNRQFSKQDSAMVKEAISLAVDMNVMLGIELDSPMQMAMQAIAMQIDGRPELTCDQNHQQKTRNQKRVKRCGSRRR